MIDDDRMVVSTDPRLAVCVAGQFRGWLMWKHPDGQWVTKRLATDDEMRDADHIVEFRADMKRRDEQFNRWQAEQAKKETP